MATRTTQRRDGEAWSRLVQEFEHHGIPLPPVFERSRAALRRVAPLTYTTRSSVGPSPYDVAHYIAESQAWVPEPYCIVAHAGHGINSWAIHYYEVSDGLALYIQSAWGGAYGNSARDSERLRGLFTQCRELQLGLLARQDDLFAAPLKPLVVEVSFYAKRWALRGSRGIEGWAETVDPLAAAIRYVTEEGTP